MNIFVGNLNLSTTEENLQALFSEFGKVNSVKIIKDFQTDTSRGYGFVDMDEKEEGIIAMKKLNGLVYMGQSMEISEAKPRPAKQNSFNGQNQNGQLRRKR